MDRAHYQLITEAIDITRLSTAVVQYADYEPCIKAATDPIIVDAIEELRRTKNMLLSALNK